MTPDALNERFAVADHLAFCAGPGGLTVAEIANARAAARVALHGAHVLSYQPRGRRPVLWMSARSRFEAGAPIRGGIPICWPWFGPHPTDEDKPAHGFARTAEWAVLGAEGLGDGSSRIRLELSDSETTRELWPHAFALELAVTVGAELTVDLNVTNPGPGPMVSGGALHSYFHVARVAEVAIGGLDGCGYIDKLDPGDRKVQRGPITIAAETDRVYLDTVGECTIDDSRLNRRITVAKSGSRSTVVWNPWIAKSARMTDFGDDESPGMVCVETANAADDVVTVPPGGTHRLQATIRVADLTPGA